MVFIQSLCDGKWLRLTGAQPLRTIYSALNLVLDTEPVSALVQWSWPWAYSDSIMPSLPRQKLH